MVLALSWRNRTILASASNAISQCVNIGVTFVYYPLGDITYSVSTLLTHPPLKHVKGWCWWMISNGRTLTFALSHFRCRCQTSQNHPLNLELLLLLLYFLFYLKLSPVEKLESLQTYLLMSLTLHRFIERGRGVNSGVKTTPRRAARIRTCFTC